MKINYHNPSAKEGKNLKWKNLKVSFIKRQTKNAFIYCWYCGREDLLLPNKCSNNSDNMLTVDHMVPHRGKLDKMFDKGNLAICCNKCNHSKGSMSLKEYLDGAGLTFIYNRLRLKRMELKMLGKVN